MKLFVVGVACSGKTTLSNHLREVHSIESIDMDDEIVAANGGVWPDIETKNRVVKPLVYRKLLSLTEALVLYSPMPPEELVRMREGGFHTVHLDVEEAELRRRHKLRAEREGWTNEEWFDQAQEFMRALAKEGLIDSRISGNRPVAEVAQDILSLRGRAG